jgi:hypothetical protein
MSEQAVGGEKKIIKSLEPASKVATTTMMRETLARAMHVLSL